MVRAWVRCVVACALVVVVLSAPAAANRMLKLDVRSERLSAFWSTPMTLHADVLLPESYDAQPSRRYPTIYWFEGFGGAYDSVARDVDGSWMRAFAALHREAIVVVPDPMFDGYYTEFADSVNNGPWGAAFADELVPAIDAAYRTDGTRFLAGHSSGGWASLWLQIAYPQTFDGAWAYAPDPVDFHDFTGPDLTLAQPGNFYRDAHGDAYLIDRYHGRNLESLEDLVTGRYGTIGPKQFASFDSVFSPRAPSGLPAPLFDRKSGTIDPAVASYWEANYDLTARVRALWPSEGPRLRGKLHVVVGAEDTFYLDEPVRRFAAALEALDGGAEVSFIQNGDHWSILAWDGGYAVHVAREALVREGSNVR